MSFSDRLLRYSFPKNSPVNISPTHKKAIFLETFAYPILKEEPKLETSSENCFTEEGFLY